MVSDSHPIKVSLFPYFSTRTVFLPKANKVTYKVLSEFQHALNFSYEIRYHRRTGGFSLRKFLAIQSPRYQQEEFTSVEFDSHLDLDDLAGLSTDV